MELRTLILSASKPHILPYSRARTLRSRAMFDRIAAVIAWALVVSLCAVAGCGIYAKWELNRRHREQINNMLERIEALEASGAGE